MAGEESGVGVYSLFPLFLDILGEVLLEPGQSFTINFTRAGL